MAAAPSLSLPAPEAPAHAPPRFAALDGLRAIAALSVALWHFQHAIPRLDAALPGVVSRLVSHGNVGVEIFFVLSGFAVARSMIGVRVDARALGRFMLRRAIRLDPPYAITLALTVILALAFPAHWPVRPTPGRVLAHLFYLQGILGIPNLLGIFWTLALEIQLYLAFAIFQGLGQRLGLLREGAAGTEDAREHGFSSALAVSAVAATALVLAPHSPRWIDFFVPWWPLFCLGVQTERALRLPAARPWLAGTVLVLLASGWWRVQIGALAAFGAVLAMVLAAALRPIDRVLSSRALTGAGLRSYSFYLLHSILGGMALNAASKHLPLTVLGDVARLAIALLASSLAAYALWRLVEVPAQRLARRVALSRAPSRAHR